MHDTATKRKLVSEQCLLPTLNQCTIAPKPLKPIHTENAKRWEPFLNNLLDVYLCLLFTQE
ncbi:hypothetical protein, partial [Vibrio genomosp. F10]|uniref:hypothetical protein n=1 Tax=Vibrio genomosp. F10 TaxID=723171 RepID=UPI001969AD7A